MVLRRPSMTPTPGAVTVRRAPVADGALARASAAHAAGDEFLELSLSRPPRGARGRPPVTELLAEVEAMGWRLEHAGWLPSPDDGSPMGIYLFRRHDPTEVTPTPTSSTARLRRRPAPVPDEPAPAHAGVRVLPGAVGWPTSTRPESSAIDDDPGPDLFAKGSAAVTPGTP